MKSQPVPEQPVPGAKKPGRGGGKFLKLGGDLGGPLFLGRFQSVQKKPSSDLGGFLIGGIG